MWLRLSFNGGDEKQLWTWPESSDDNTSETVSGVWGDLPVRDSAADELRFSPLNFAYIPCTSMAYMLLKHSKKFGRANSAAPST